MKIAIIGAGINGLYLAWKLADAGHEVSVFDRKQRVGDNVVCSGLFSSRILDFIPQSQKLIQNRINYALIHFPKKTIRVNFSKPFFVMDHTELDRIVADLAQDKNAKIILNQNITEIPTGFDRVIGCDGANSIVRKKLELKNPKFRLGVLEIRKGKTSADFVETWPRKTGFSWRIPRGDDVEIGQIETRPGLVETRPGLVSKVIPEGLIVPRHKTITLCGDAVGLTKPWSGGGVIWGLTAADILIKSFPDFQKYRKRVKLSFTHKMVLGKIAVAIVYFLGFHCPWLLPKKVKIDSDFLIKIKK